MARATKAKRVVLAIGLPGSGKSSYFARRGIKPLSSDLLRALLFDDPAEQRRPDLVFELLRHLLETRLRTGRPVTYVDATNLTRRDRQPFLQLAREYRCRVDALFFDVPLAACLARNRARERRVPEAALRRMAGRLEPPTTAEGFRRIVTVGLVRGKARGRSRRAAVS
jgi:predicted kinase